MPQQGLSSAEMPRRPRIEVPGGIFHVASRGVNGAFVYRKECDRNDFLDLLWTAVGTYEWSCQSYCLMDTHFHLIVQTPNANLAAGMQLLNGRYAQRFNWRYDRAGHLFASRFTSVQIETGEHLRAAHRYVARNPVRAGLCANPAAWEWSSYRATVGLEAPPIHLDVTGALRVFADTGKPASISYAAAVSAETSPLDDLPYELAATAGV